MRRFLEWRRLAVVASLAGALVALPSDAQETAGLTFDVSVNTGDSTAGTHQTGRGWIAGKRMRLDLRGGVPGAAIPFAGAGDISIITDDSSGSPVVALVMHETKKVMYPSRMMAQLREMMEAMTEKPVMTFAVSNIVMDTLGPGETISGFATKRYKVSVDILMSIEMMGEQVTESMHMESEGDVAEELREYADPLRDTRGFGSLMAGMPWIDSVSMAEMQKLIRAAPPGLALRQVDRVTGVTEGGEPVKTTTTRLSNIKRESVPLSVFAVPDGYTELEMPMMDGPEVN